MKRLLKVIPLILILTIFITPIQTARADSPGDASMPKIEDLFNGQNNSPYITTYRDNYYLDTVEAGSWNIKENLENGVNTIANVLFSLQCLAGRLLISIFYYCFQINMYQMFSDIITTFVTTMRTTLFDQLSLLAISLLGVYFVIMMIRNQRTQVWVAVLETCIIMALAIFFYNTPMSLPKGVDSFSKDVSQMVLSGTFKATNDGQEPDSAVVAASNNMWYIFVHQPWQILEFGNVSLAKQHEAKILTMAPYSDERQAYIKTISKDKEHFTPDWGAKRLGLVLLYFIPMTILFAVILILSLLMLGYQFLTVLYTLLGVFVFILALIPFFGVRIIENWFFKILSSGGIKILISFLLGIIVVCITTLFSVTETYGWLVTLLLEVLIVLIIVFKRDSIIELFTSLRLAPENAKAFQNRMMKDVNIEQKVNDYAKNIRMRNNAAKDDSYGGADSDQEYSQGGSFKKSNTAKKDYSGTSNSSGHSSSPNHSEHTEYAAHDGSPEGESILGLPENNDSQAQTQESLSQLMKKAEDVLDKMYEVSKAASDEKAEKTGKPAEYSEFVNKVDTREKLGAPKYDQREVQAVADEIQRVEKAGGSVNDIVYADKRNRKNEVQRPSSVMDIANEPKVKEETAQAAASDQEVVDYKQLTQDYSEEFNSQYDRNYDVSFMQGLTKKYGHSNVRAVMDNMKNVKNQEGIEHNPAGYLTQSLKNRANDQARQRAMDQAKVSDSSIRQAISDTTGQAAATSQADEDSKKPEGEGAAEDENKEE